MSDPKPLRVAIIGAGPSGLVTLKYLKTAHKYFPISPIQVRVFEAEASVGGTFAYRTYEDAELVSSRQLTTFSDFRLPDAPNFISTKKYCEYLEAYCTHFGLWDAIGLGSKVVGVRRRSSKKIKGNSDGASGHVVTYEVSGSEEEWECDAVAVCSGLHVTPAIANVKGIERVPVVMHSSDFKERKQFGIDKNVVILGSGETGMDLAYLAITAKTRSVTLCHRDGFQIAPKKFPNPILRNGKPSADWELPPMDTASPSLFDSAYVHPVVRDSIILWTWYDRWLKFSLWFISGSYHGLDQWIGYLPDHRYHASKLFPNKSSLAIPYISAPYRKITPGYKKRAAYCQIPIPPTDGRVVDLAPWPSHIDSLGIIHFTENGRPEADTMRSKTIKPDVVIYATGYRQTFPFFSAEDNYPTPKAADMRRIWSSSDPTVGFVGFVRPGFGAIPPLSEMQAQLWTMKLIDHCTPLKLFRKPLQFESHYRMRLPEDARIDYGVDMETYVYQLALDMGSAPSVLQVARCGWKTAVTWALGVNFNTKFRLVGPWRWDGARAVIEEELWPTVRDRGNYGHITLNAIPIVLFGILNLVTAIIFAPVDLARYMWSFIA